MNHHTDATRLRAARAAFPALLGSLFSLAVAMAPAPTVAQEVASEGGIESAERARHPTARSSYRVRAAGARMRVDARLDEAAWSVAEIIPLPIEIQPGDNTAATVRTDCRVTFDEEALYLGCTAYDPDPEAIRAFMTDRDRIVGNNDRISFLIDPFNDTRRGWVFEVSPLGVQADLVYDERTDSFDDAWDAIWSSAGRITTEGYVVEAAIPFRSLRFPAGGDVQTWRFWINRMHPRNQYRIMRTNTRIRGEACQLCQAPVMVGIEGVTPGRNVEVTPTVVASRSDLVASGSPLGAGLEAGAVEWEPGLDARWSITTDLALNATLNPDFSQVEADAPQLEANNRFALFFPEKRPFFLEGADLFHTPIQAVFTRTVADPSGGVKLTGKLGRHGLGVLVTRDEVNNLLIPGPEGSRSAFLSQEVTGAMARYRGDLGGQHTVGGLYTARSGADGYLNHVAGVDAFIQPSSEVTVNLQALGSATRYPTSVIETFDQPDGSFGGYALLGVGRYSARNWGVTAQGQLLDDGFRADAGFVPQVGRRYLDLYGHRTFFGDAEDFFTAIRFQGGAWSDRRVDGSPLNEGFWGDLRYEGPLQSTVWVNPGYRWETFDGASYDILNTFVGLSVRPVSWLRLGLSGNGGGAIDFRNGRKVDETRLAPSFDVQVGRNGEVGASHQVQSLTLEGDEVLTAHAGQLRVLYNFSTRLYVRGITQYRRTERNPGTNPGLQDAVSEGIFTSLLFSYKVNPLTVLFLGYTDDRAALDDPQSRGPDFVPTGRTFFLKVGYAWRP